MKTFGLAVLLSASLALAGCGRKNLPVAPAPVTTPIGQSATPNQDNQPASTANFRRAGRVATSGADLTVTPAEVSRNPQSPAKSFPLDFLLN